jgi:tRNA-specific adenosine deaminase 1
MTELADCVARVALDHYERILPTKGKPKEDEWTVYAALVATTLETAAAGNGSRRHCWVVSSATGTKCTAARSNQGYILHDSHAEALVRRGLVRVLWKEVERLQQEKRSDKTTAAGTTSADDQNRLLEETCKPNSYRLLSDIDLHLYISDSPCGDASIYSLDGHDNTELLLNAADKVQFTGAKVIVSQATAVDSAACGGHHQLLEGSAVAREDVQLLGKLRTKSGRSNIIAEQRSTCMSCSDKLVRWSVCGLQGSLLSDLIPDPITLSSIVVSRDWRVAKPESQLQALQRAVPDRVVAVVQSLLEGRDALLQRVGRIKEYASTLVPPRVALSEESFARGKSESEIRQGKYASSRKRKRQEEESTLPAPIKVSTCGISINWQQTDCRQVELTVGARGILHGKKPKNVHDYCSLRSRLCRGGMVALAKKCGLQVGSAGPTTYHDWKMQRGSKLNTELRDCILESESGPLAGWLLGGGDFEISSKLPVREAAAGSVDYYP